MLIISRNRRSRSFAARALLATLLGTSCAASEVGPTGPVAVASMEVRPARSGILTSFPGDSLQLVAIVRDASGATLNGREVLWTSRAPSVATVSMTGLVRSPAYTGGESRAVWIVALSGGASDSALVTISPTPVFEVTNLPDSILVNAGNSVQLAPKLLDAQGQELTGRTVEYVVSDASVAAVSSSGLLVAEERLNISIRQIQLTVSIAGVSAMTQVSVLPRASFVDVGASFSCALSVSRSAWCWGFNAQGQLGDGTKDARATPAVVLFEHSFRSLVTLAVAACGLSDDGTAFCWGGNAYGQLGDGSLVQRSTPAAVAGGVKFAALSGGGHAACGLSLDGRAFCWGHNSSGQLGDGTQVNRTTPTEVQSAVQFTSITMGDYHACGLTSAGLAYCWGNNNLGQLGDGTLDSRSSSPRPVVGGIAFKAIVLGSGDAHTCGLAVSGTVYCWGGNSFGQIGIGTIDREPTVRNTPTPVEGGVQFVDIDAGPYYTCAITFAGEAFCWGQILGVIAASDASIPSRVEGLPPVARIAVRFHLCALSFGGAIYCWGRNPFGQVGDGTTKSPRSLPVQVGGSTLFGRVR